MKGKGNRLQEEHVPDIVSDRKKAYLVIDAHRPERGILSVQEQNKPRSPVPEYYGFKGIEDDENFPDAVILLFRQNGASDEYKREPVLQRLRIRRSELKNMIVALQTK